MDQDHGNEIVVRSGTGSELVDKPLQVNADNIENTSTSRTPQEQQSVEYDTASPPPKPIKRSTTLSEHQEGAIDKDRDARKAKAESKYLAKCDRLEQTCQGTTVSEAQRKEKQDKLDEEHHKKLNKIDKRYHRKLEKAERKAGGKAKAKQEDSSSSSQSSTHASSAPDTPVKEPKKNRVKSFFSSVPSSSGGSYSGRRTSSTFNPAIGGAAVMPMFGAGGGGIGGVSGGHGGGCDGGGRACGAGTGGC